MGNPWLPPVPQWTEITVFPLPCDRPCSLAKARRGLTLLAAPIGLIKAYVKVVTIDQSETGSGWIFSFKINSYDFSLARKRLYIAIWGNIIKSS